MYTRCPCCHTVFHLHASQLTAARGQVRCGDCGQIFQSLDFLYDDPDRALANLEPLRREMVARAAAGKPRPEPDRRFAAHVADVPAHGERQVAHVTEVPTRVEPQIARVADFPAQVEPQAADVAEFPTRVEPQVAGVADAPAQVEHQSADVADVPTPLEPQVEAVPEAVEDDEPTTRPAAPEPQVREVAVQVEDDAPEQAGRESPEPEQVAEASDTDKPLRADEPLEVPRFEIPPDLILRSPVEQASWSAGRLAGWAAVVVLALGLAAQGVYVSRQVLATEPALAPWMVRFCNVFGCELPPARDLADIQVLERLVREHPQGKDALLVHTTLVNKAPFVQPYPILELRLADLSGGLVAGRRFKPSEYLPENTDIEAGMRPDVPVTAELELVRPAIDVVSYQFDFL